MIFEISSSPSALLVSASNRAWLCWRSTPTRSFSCSVSGIGVGNVGTLGSGDSRFWGPRFFPGPLDKPRTPGTVVRATRARRRLRSLPRRRSADHWLSTGNARGVQHQNDCCQHPAQAARAHTNRRRRDAPCRLRTPARTRISSPARGPSPPKRFNEASSNSSTN